MDELKTIEFERELRNNPIALNILRKKDDLNNEKGDLIKDIVSIKEQLRNREYEKEQANKILRMSIYSVEDYIEAKKKLKEITQWQRNAGKSKMYKNIRVQEIRNELMKLNNDLKPIKIKIFENLNKKWSD